MLKVSIILPIYNVETYLKRSLDTVLNQSYENWECILVNDGSTDDSEKVCRAYVEKDKRFRLYNQENSGSGAARRHGMNKANGDYICFIDPDDYIDTEALHHNVMLAERYNPDIIANGYNELREKKVNQRKPLIHGLFDQEEFRANFKKYAMVGVTALWNKMYKHSFLKENDLNFMNQRIGQDALFNYEAYKYVNSLYVDDNCYYYYDLTRDDSVVNTYSENRFDYEKNILNAFKDLISYWNRENEYKTELVIREWNILFNEIKNINLQNSPYSREQKIKLLNEFRTSDSFQKLLAEISDAQIPSRISRIIFNLLKREKYHLLLAVINLYLKIRSYY